MPCCCTYCYGPRSCMGQAPQRVVKRLSLACESGISADLFACAVELEWHAVLRIPRFRPCGFDFYGPNYPQKLAKNQSLESLLSHVNAGCCDLTVASIHQLGGHRALGCGRLLCVVRAGDRRHTNPHSVNCQSRASTTEQMVVIASANQ